MKKFILGNLVFFGGVLIALVGWSYWVVISHPQHSIVSWDEGFHGGSAFFISEAIKIGYSEVGLEYLRNNFLNGIIWYPPLWLLVAGPLGAYFGSSVEIYRIATLVFGFLSILLVVYFTKSQAGWKAGILAGIALAMCPIFIVYSHLMMREVPLLFSVTVALTAFFNYLSKKKLTSLDLLLTFLAFIIGVLSKILAIAVIFSTLVLFGLFIYFWFKKSQYYERFFSKWTVYFLLGSFLSFTLYRFYIKTTLNADMVLFYLNQSRSLTGNNSGLLFSLSDTFFKNFNFYFSDFLMMPLLSIVWFGSLFGYLLIRKSMLGFYLLAWVLASFLFFTSVKPQAIQYILPVYTPLAIVTGLFLNELLKIRNKLIGFALFLIVAIGLFYTGYINLNKTQTIYWRSLITNQDLAARYLVDKAKFGDRVIASGDGNIFLLRLYGLDKKLQIINGASKICSRSLKDSTEWAFLDFGPQNPVKISGISEESGWEEVVNFENQLEGISILRNTNETDELSLSEDSIVDGCARFLPPGSNEMILTATPTVKNEYCPLDNDLKIKFRNNREIVGELKISQEDLEKQNGVEQQYKLVLSDTNNKLVFLTLDIPENVTFDIKNMEIKSFKNLTKF